MNDMTSPSFCDGCGAALSGADTLCPFCGQAVQAVQIPPRSYASQILPKINQPPMQRHSILMQRYRIFEKIGEGGFGLVYKASDKKNNKTVAIKQINLATLSMQQMIDVTDSYNREITLLPRLMHRNLPQMFDHFTDADHWYIVMEYINGETLEELLAKRPDGRLPMKQALDIGITLCDVLTYLHSQQPAIIYRDVKPANIMITNKGDIYLIDFGIARRYRINQSRDTGLLGSPGYAAPEQYGKAQTTPQTDIYGLGATLQTLLTGKEPLEIRTGGIPSDCDIPTELQRFLKYMQNNDVSKRPENLRKVAQYLENFKKRYCGMSRWLISPFAWLAALWGLAILLVSNFLPPFSLFALPLWIFYFLASLCSILLKGLYYLYKAKKMVAGRLSVKEIGIIINESFSQSFVMIYIFFITGWVSALIPTLFRPFPRVEFVMVIGFIIISISMVFVILRVLPWLLKQRQRMRTPQQNPLPEQTPPLQQQTH